MWRMRSRPERWLLLEAMVGLFLGRAAIGLLPFEQVASLLGLAPENVSGVTPGDYALQLEWKPSAVAVQIGWAVRTVAARVPEHAICLVQTLAGAAMLRRRDIPCTLSLGIARDGTGFAAHAWLRCGDVILTGAGGHDRFTTISAFVAARAASQPTPV